MSIIKDCPNCLDYEVKYNEHPCNKCDDTYSMFRPNDEVKEKNIIKYAEAYGNTYSYVNGGKPQPDEPSVQRLQEDLRAMREALKFGIAAIGSIEETNVQHKALLKEFNRMLQQTTYMDGGNNE